jgi:hypothetical protein
MEGALMIAMHPLWIVMALGLSIAALPLLALWLRDRRIAALHEQVFRIQQPSRPPSAAPKAGAMSEEARAAALRELLWQWQRFGEPAFTVEGIMEVCSMTPQQATAFMHWARGQVLRPNGRPYRCVVDCGAMGTRWLRFRLVLPSDAKWPLIEEGVRA